MGETEVIPVGLSEMQVFSSRFSSGGWRLLERRKSDSIQASASPTRKGNSFQPRGGGKRLLKIITALAASWALLGATAEVANASHFRYGHYSWQPLGGTDTEFTLQNAFRRDGYSCIDPASQAAIACTAPDSLPGVGDVIVENIGNTTFSPGDGSAAIGSPFGPLEYLVTAVDPAQNFLFGLALDPASLPTVDTTIAHTYPTSGDFLAFTESCCRIGELINNAGGNYRVETLVNVGSGNGSPVSALPPIVQCPINGLCSFIVPGSDPDGDPLQFRLSTDTEASGVAGGFTQPGPLAAPNAASINATTGEYTWDTSGATLAASGDTLYSTQVTIEDQDASTGAVKSKVALDFLIKLVTVINDPPIFDSPPTPACGSTQSVAPGSALSFTVTASDPNAGDTVTLNAAGLPAGATMTPMLPTAGNPVTAAFSWTPTTGQTGMHVVTFSATDDTGQQTLCSVTIEVLPPGGVDLSVTKADAPDPVTPGGNLTYTVTVTNNGPDPSTDSTLTDTLPAEVAFVSATPSQGSCSGTVTCSLGPLAVGATATVEIVVTVDPTVDPAADCPLANTASVLGAEADPDSANDTATAETACVVPPTECAGEVATIVGTNGDDALVGTPGDDVIQALDGDDVVHGLGGNDLICGGDGDDELFGGRGRDRLLGDNDDDSLFGGRDRDELDGANGADELAGGRGDDTLAGGNGQDELVGGADDDELSGNAGADDVFGGPGDDFVFGGPGTDDLDGGAGDDQLSGENGDDDIIGGRGDDLLSGGFGDDQLSGTSGDDQLLGEIGDDELGGGTGNDSVDGGADSDDCDGGFGTDTDTDCEVAVGFP